MLGTLILCSSVPDFFNRYGLYVFPQYWRNLWILVYFYLGAYIRTYYEEFPPSWFEKYKRWWLFGCVGICSFSALVSFVFIPKHDYVALLGGASSPPAVILSTVIFLTCYQVKRIPYVAEIISTLARYSLEIYLFSYLFDQLVYAWVRKHLFVSQSQIFLWYVPIVGCVLLLSLFASWLKGKVFLLGRVVWKKV